jgi:acetate kinase
MKILVINCGSSSIKYQLFESDGWSVLVKGGVDRIGESMAELRQIWLQGDAVETGDPGVSTTHPRRVCNPSISAGLTTR